MGTVDIQLHDVAKTFPGDPRPREVLANISLSVKKGEVIAIRGDNGTGKTTLLNLIAGLDVPTKGSITLNDAAEGGKPRVGFAQQDYTSSLLPWYNVIENIALPLKIKNVDRKEREEKAKALLSRLNFELLPESAYPHQLSGGQKQRVAISRALIHDPHVLLLDEPFANLDAHTIRDLQNTLSDVYEAAQPTMLIVSHEIAHCIFLADRIVVLHGSPAKIAVEFEVKLPRPRRRQIMFTAEYEKIRSRIIEAEEVLYAQRK
jgi:NitT/TauT family transport system ATP-binding protein